jgi:hypothetical protein
MSGEIEVAMNCRAIREKLNEALAAGEAEALDRDAVLHLQGCSGCRDHREAQAKLYGAIDSGVRELVRSDAPPSLLPWVRQRLAATDAQPNRAWVGVLAPAIAVLLVFSALFLLTSHVRKVQESRTADVPASQPYVFPPPESRQLRNSEAETETVASNHRPKTFHHVLAIPRRVAVTTAPVIVDPGETAAFVPMANEIAQNPEATLPALRKSALSTNQGEAIEPVSIAKLEIPALVAEVEERK